MRKRTIQPSSRKIDVSPSSSTPVADKSAINLDVSPSSSTPVAEKSTSSPSITIDLEKVVSAKLIDQSDLGKSGMKIEQGMGAKNALPIETLTEIEIQQYVDTNDPHLWNGARILVPVDVQALVVEEGSDVKSAWGSIQGQRSTSNQYADKWANLETTFEEREGDDSGSLAAKYKEAFTYSNLKNGVLPLPVGIHLHWAMPDALLHGELKDSDEIDDKYLDPNDLVNYQDSMVTVKDAISQGLEIPNNPDNSKTIAESISFPQLPDRWLVTRHWKENRQQKKKYWVIESDTLKATELNLWNPPDLREEKIAEMTAIGPHTGDHLWTVTYENASGRFTFHDDPGRGISGPLHYTVCGWYSNKTHDPLFASPNLSEIEWFRRVREDLRWAIDEISINNAAEFIEAQENNYVVNTDVFLKQTHFINPDGE
ncbi:MAG: hypothetical protein HOC79_09290 [Euryarchaeota archaeon]|nr:hypothetical protein [Euryarchaeota archaeon]